MVHHLNPKNLHISGFFPAKSKKTYFGGVFGHYTQNEIISEKSGSVSFLLLRQPNFMRSKITFLTSSNKPVFILFAEFCKKWFAFIRKFIFPRPCYIIRNGLRQCNFC